MKVLKIIKKIPSLKHATNNNKSKNFIKSSNNPKESASIYSTVRPELLEIMLNLGLIQQNMHCNNCKTNIEWSREKCVDLLHWKCPGCDKKSEINLAFEDNCSFKDVLQMLLSCLNNEDVNEVSERLGLKKVTIQELYNFAGKTVERSIHSNILQWRLGGPGVIVLIDTYPDGFTNTTSNDTPILCFAELKALPPTMWFKALESGDNLETNRMKCLEVVQQIILPGSIIIARRDSRLCSYDNLLGIQHKFDKLVSIEGLARHNSEKQNLFDNLNVIWKETLDVCMAAQHYHHSLIQTFLFCYMWKRKFRNDEYPKLLDEVSYLVD